MTRVDWHPHSVGFVSDHSTSLERLRMECLDIRTQVEQSTDTHGSPSDDVHAESLSDAGSAADDVGLASDVGLAVDGDDVGLAGDDVGLADDDDNVTLTARSSDINTQCLVNISQHTDDDYDIDQYGEYLITSFFTPRTLHSS